MSDSVSARIVLNGDTEEYYFEEGCFITEWSNASTDAQASVARACVLPGVSTRWHRLRDITERYVMLAGTCSVEVGDLPPTIVGPGDVVIIPPGVAQRITNAGIEDAIFLAICTPRFVRDAYEDIEALADKS